jgi:flagellar hook assembly protein FlgD
VLEGGPLVVGQQELRFTLPSPSDVRLRVLDPGGRLVREIRAGWMSAGTHVLRWDQHDAGGRRVASGVYFAALEAGAERWQLRWIVYR